MKVLNRPMFRMGGPIKEGIMSGIKEPRRQGYATPPGFVIPNDPNKMIVDKSLKNAEAFMKVGKSYDQDLNNQAFVLPTNKIKKPVNNEIDLATIGGYGEIEKPSIEYEKIPKYIADVDGDGISDINPEYTKNKSFINDIFGGPFKRKTNEEFAPQAKAASDGTVTTQGKSPFAYTADEVIKNKGKVDSSDDEPKVLSRKDKVDSILEGLGYDRASKNALYDAMIKAGQRISRTGLGAENLVSDVIAETSQSYDKPEKLREAANLMQVQQDLKLDQIEASKSNKTEEDFNFYVKQFGGGDEGKKKALRMLTKDAQSETEAYLAAKKSTGSGLDGVKAGIEWMIRDGQIGANENKGEISKKSHDNIKDFVASDEFKRKGAGVYQLEGIVARIDANGSVEIIKSFGTISEKTNKWWGFGS